MLTNIRFDEHAAVDEVIEATLLMKAVFEINNGEVSRHDIDKVAIFHDAVGRDHVVFIPNKEESDGRYVTINEVLVDEFKIPYLRKFPMAGTLDFTRSNNIRDVLSSFNSENNPRLFGKFVAVLEGKCVENFSVVTFR